MPRDTNGVMQQAAGTVAVPDTLIESDKFNLFASDVISEMNGVRPESCGGTGQVSIAAALDVANVPFKTEYTNALVNMIDVSLEDYSAARVGVFNFVPETDNVNLNMQVSVDGISFVNVDELTSLQGTTLAANLLTDNGSKVSNVTSENGWNGIIDLFGLNALCNLTGHAYGLYNVSGVTGLFNIRNSFRTTTIVAIKYLRFAFSTGRIKAGSITVEKLI